ncbi:PaaI family thioesterase [Alterisphingorhabdus coralli]|uniref:PaaI family thioesterase n=1 Tax=Alterisphingorhabdus coralli TaxID=3071408 RepID=A0AA97F9E4_9SPHN|nr:PaaI family thioesterase [Parasphingorhabdus sp. SCSIO 66989]WOE75462.1 PaaI family thioesterase [Parasphingorhabdus sp. SCSIO 66989]
MSGANTLEQASQGAAAHFRSLESLYASAQINALFDSQLSIAAEGQSVIEFTITPAVYHAAGAAHGTIYFKMLDDAAFYAANSMVSDRFLLTTAFNLHFTKPVKEGKVRAEGKWISGHRRVLVAESRLVDTEGDEIGRGTGTFMRSHIGLSGLDGYHQ